MGLDEIECSWKYIQECRQLYATADPQHWNEEVGRLCNIVSEDANLDAETPEYVEWMGSQRMTMRLDRWLHQYLEHARAVRKIQLNMLPMLQNDMVKTHSGWTTSAQLKARRFLGMCKMYSDFEKNTAKTRKTFWLTVDKWCDNFVRLQILAGLNVEGALM